VGGIARTGAAELMAAKTDPRDAGIADERAVCPDRFVNSRL
jgi:hypothetical protein